MIHTWEDKAQDRSCWCGIILKSLIAIEDSHLQWYNIVHDKRHSQLVTSDFICSRCHQAYHSRAGLIISQLSLQELNPLLFSFVTTLMYPNQSSLKTMDCWYLSMWCRSVLWQDILQLQERSEDHGKAPAVFRWILQYLLNEGLEHHVSLGSLLVCCTCSLVRCGVSSWMEISKALISIFSCGLTVLRASAICILIPGTQLMTKS